MSEHPLEREEVARDDAFLDLLGSGAAPQTNDPAIRALYLWRIDISTGLTDSPAAKVNGHRRAYPCGDTIPEPGLNGSSGSARSGELSPSIRPGVDTPSGETPAGERTTSRRSRHRRRPGRRRATVAAAAVGLSAGLSGVAVAAADAQPGSPLWPITKVIYSDTAADRQAEADAEAALDQARQALAEGRMADAQRYLDEANRRAGAVHSDEADELRDDLNAVRSEIKEKENGGSTEPSNPPSDSDGSTDGGTSPTPEPPAPSPTSGGKDGKGKGDPGGKQRQGASRENLVTGSPDVTSSESTVSPTTY